MAAPHGYDTVTEALTALNKAGYTIDFSISHEADLLTCREPDIRLLPDMFEIDAVYRFEGDSDPGDEMIVYAISSLDKKWKGTLLNAFGTYAESGTSRIAQRLKMHAGE